jgi:hypothetical protein
MTHITTVDLLRAARAKIERPECWTTKYYAHDATGGECEASAREAVCWCALGAVKSVTTHGCFHTLWELLRAQLPHGSVSISTYNDAPSTTHADILLLFDRAIAAAESK